MGGIPRDFLPGMQSLHLSHPTGAEESHGNLVVVMVRGCAAALAFGLGLFFLLAARSLWIITFNFCFDPIYRPARTPYLPFSPGFNWNKVHVFILSGVVLCFGFRRKPMLMAQPWFSCS